jgi:hypothetical protein
VSKNSVRITFSFAVVLIFLAHVANRLRVLFSARKQEWDTTQQRLVEFKNGVLETRLRDFFQRIAFLRVHAPGAVWHGAFTVLSK